MKDNSEIKKQYDFSKGVQGKFFHQNAVLNLPIYLDDDLIAFVEEFAKEKHTDLQTVVNDILRNSKQMLQASK